MARPREFDEATVVQKARDAFWANGVSATSISDLSEATGLSVGSLYKAFDNKQNLCHRTLDDYLDEAIDVVAAMLMAGPTPLDGIKAWLAGAAEVASSDSPSAGCYATVCTMELASTDPVVRERLQKHDREFRGLVSDRLRAAAASGDVSIDPDVGARLLCTTLNGVQLEARKGISRADAQATFDAALRALV